jgi:methylmalonyl-CoA/ethylmalonyl-CoA epimerase
MPELRLDHVAVAVNSIKPSLDLFMKALGGEYLMGGDNPANFRWFQVRYPGGGKIELVEPTGGGFMADFLDSRGEGLHHLTFKTDDILSAIAHIESCGYTLVDVSVDNEYWKEAFLRPSHAHGTVIQIAQSAAPDDVVAQHLRPSNLDELLS